MHIARRTVFGDGGASLIGSHLTQQLLEAGAASGYPVRQLRARLPRGGGEPGAGPAVTLSAGDITRLPELLDALDQVDGVFCPGRVSDPALSQNPGSGSKSSPRHVQHRRSLPLSRRQEGWCSRPRGAVWQPEVDEVDERTPFPGRPTPPRSRSMPQQDHRREPLRLYQQRYGLDYVRCVTPREHGDVGDYAASGSSSTIHVRVPVLKHAPNSWFSVFTGFGAANARHVLLHCICCFLQNRLLTTWFTVDSTNPVAIASPLRYRSP